MALSRAGVTRAERVSNDTRREIAKAMAGGVCLYPRLAMRLVEMSDQELRSLVAAVRRRVRMVLFEESGQGTARRVGDDN